MVFFMAFGAFRRGNALIYMRLKFPLMFEWEFDVRHLPARAGTKTPLSPRNCGLFCLDVWHTS
jgi:hypothetical protein